MKRKLITFFVNNWLTILLAFIPPIVITYYFQRDVRHLDIVLRSNTQVVQIEERYSDGITVFYQTNKIDTLNVLEVEVKNSGNRPIENTDFKQPLTLKFKGTVLLNPKPLDASPPELKPELTLVGRDTLKLEPLLLNQGDHFTFLAYLIDSPTPSEPFTVSARVSGIKSPRLRDESDHPGKRQIKIEFLSWFLGVVGAIISLISFLSLGKRFKEITLEFSPWNAGIGVTLRPSDRESTVQSLARELSISGQDFKANLLLLRIKIEEQLREMANRVDLPSHMKLTSPTSLTRQLSAQGVLPGQVAAGIADVLPVINRELHASEAYLSRKEFESLQQFTLQLVAELTRLNQAQEKSSEQQE